MKPSDMPWKLSQSKTLNGYTFRIESADGYTIGEFYGSTNPMWDSVPGARQAQENAKFVVDSSERIAELEKLLAASQLQNTQLREALTNLYYEFERTREWACLPIAMVRARASIAIPADTTALEAMIAKAGEVMREELIAKCIALGAISSDGRFVDEIRALPGVTLEDLKT